MSYKNLEIWQLAREEAIEIHKMSLEQLPKFEQFETGQQIRRSSKSTRSTIVEGYGRRTYQSEYFKFLTYAIASNDETIDHLNHFLKLVHFRIQKLTSKSIRNVNYLGKNLITLSSTLIDNPNIIS